MIEDVWSRMSEDPLAQGYSFKRIGTPEPNEDTMSKCRELCQQNLCGAYNVTWGCPPGIGSPSECLSKVKDYSHAAVIIRKFENLDLNDNALIESIASDHQEMCRRFGNVLRNSGYDVLPLADGGCKYCGDCSYPDDPCRFPDQMVSSISCYGILMDEYMGSQGIDFTFEKNGMTLYGLMLYNEP